MIEMEGSVIDATSEIIHFSNSKKVACPELSKEFGIDNFDSPFPDISMVDPY